MQSEIADSDTESLSAGRVGFRELLRSNRNYRFIWIGEVASWLGDWFASIALYTLVQRLTGSPFALGLVFLTQLVPFALASPLAGLIVDRFDRRRLMITADLVRATIVLGFLFVRAPEHLPLLYGLVILQVLLTSVFIPARSASIPNITNSRELLTANALSAATWSTLLAAGAALGGFATELLGIRAVFVIDSMSYLVSAICIARTCIPRKTDPSDEGLRRVIRGMIEGWRYIVQRPAVGRMALTKATWALGGGGLIYMLALQGELVAPDAPALGIGLLYAARGVGTGIGPVLLRWLLPSESLWPVMIGLGVMVSGIMYIGVGLVPPYLTLLMLLVLVAHTPSGANWVASSVLLQKRSEDRFRGRVFGTEWLLVTLADSVSILTASVLLQRGLLDLRSAVAWFGAVQVACGLMWMLWVAPRERLPAPG